MLTRRDLFSVDPKSPEFIEHFQALLPDLKTRRLSKLYALHYHVTKAGVKCLDLDLQAASTEELDQIVRSRIDELWGINPDQVLIAAPDEEWMAFTQAPIRHVRRISLPQFLNVVVGTGKDMP